MRIRLTQKFADHIQSIDPDSQSRAGEIVNRPKRDASILLARGWAETLIEGEKESGTIEPPRDVAADQAPAAAVFRTEPTPKTKTTERRRLRKPQS